MSVTRKISQRQTVPSSCSPVHVSGHAFRKSRQLRFRLLENLVAVLWSVYGLVLPTVSGLRGLARLGSTTVYRYVSSDVRDTAQCVLRQAVQGDKGQLVPPGTPESRI